MDRAYAILGQVMAVLIGLGVWSEYGSPSAGMAVYFALDVLVDIREAHCRGRSR